DLQRLHDAVDDGLGPGGAPGHIDVHRDDGVHAALDVVAVLEHAAGTGADAHRHHHLRLRHLGVDLLDDAFALVVDAPGDQQDVRLRGVAGVDDAKALKVVFGRGAGQHLDVAAVAAAAVVVQ